MKGKSFEQVCMCASAMFLMISTMIGSKWRKAVTNENCTLANLNRIEYIHVCQKVYMSDKMERMSQRLYTISILY